MQDDSYLFHSMKRLPSFLTLGIVCLFPSLLGAEPLSSAQPVPPPPVTSSSPKSNLNKGGMKSASEIIAKQQPGKIYPQFLDHPAPESLAILVSLSKQRAYLLVNGQVAVDTPISSGKRNGWTHKGEFTILEKDPDHHSTLYGDFVNGEGRVVRSGISSKLDAAPSGTRFHGASMKYFMRLTPEGIGMHVGILPGYPASHGCIRLPLEMAQAIYNKVSVNTPVTVTD